jgi:cobalt-zinc-cadmium efflux system outer membrane protein
VIDLHPGVAAMESAAAAQRARVRLAKAERIPDVNLDLFYRRLQGTRENAFDVGVRVPIPLFGSTRSRVREAESELRAAEARLQSTRNEIGHELHARELALQRTLETAAVLKADVLPKVSAILRGAEARYRAGDISLSELMVIRREAASSQMKYLESLRSVMEAWAGLKLH